MIYEHHGILSNDSSVNSLVQQVIRFGEVVPSRYGPCLEILGGRLQLPSGTLIVRKKMNYSLGWMEMFQLLGGVYDLDNIKRVTPNANHALFTYEMAYGPRIMPQIPTLLEALAKDPDTRQAILFVGKPSDGMTSNLPCTVSIQFLVRKGILNSIVHMRSWDLCRGLPYDLMMFSGLLEMVGRFLILETGTVTVFSGSTHIYVDQMDIIPKLSERTWEFTEVVPDTLPEAMEWFQEGMNHIEIGKTPNGIEYLDQT